MDKLKLLLKELGVGTDLINTYTSSDAEKTKALDPEKDSNTIRDKVKDALKNDPVFLGTITNNERSKVLSAKENKFIKLFELTKEEMSGLPEVKKFDDMVALGHKKMFDQIEALKKGGGKGGTSETAQKQIDELNQQVVDLKVSIKDYDEVQIPQIQKDAQSKVSAYETKSTILSHISKHSDKLLVAPKFTLANVMEDLGSKYSIVNKEGKVSIMNKEDANLKAFKGNAETTIEAEIETFLTDNKLFKLSNAKPPKPGEAGYKKGDETHTEGEYNPRGLSKADAALKEMEGSTEE